MSIFAAVLIVATGCTGGDESTAGDASPTPEAVATRTPDAPQPTPGADNGDEDRALAPVLRSVLGGGLGDAGAAAGGLEPGDPALKALLPSAGEFPDGFVPFGEFAFKASDGISADGKIDMAMTVAMSRDLRPTDVSDAGILIAMVMHPEDLQDLGSALNSINDLDPAALEDEVRRGIGASGNTGADVRDVQVFPVTGIGDGGFGMQVTLGLNGASGQAGALPGALGIDEMVMRVHIFARGDYMGAVIRMGYSDTLPPSDAELALARATDAKLAAQ
jgi:hypothetical protein